MVVVPRYTGAEVAPTNAPTTRVTASDQGRGALARGVQNLAGSINGIIAAEIQKADESALLDYDNGLAQDRQALDVEASQLRGKNAIGAGQTILPKFEQAAGKREEALPGRLRHRATQLRQRHQQTLQTGLARHELAESDRYHADTANASLNLSADEAVQNRADPEAMNESMARGLLAATLEWNRLGFGPEQQEHLRRNLVSTMHRRVVEATLAEDPVAGLESLEQYRKYLNASDATALAERTAPAVREEAAYSAGMAAVNGGAIPGMPTVRTDEDDARDGPAVQAQYQEIAKRHGFNVTSTTRTPEENKAVGGVANSQHLHGTAIDLSVKGKTREQVEAIAADYRAAGFKVITRTHGTGPHVHVELPKVRRERGTANVGPAQSEAEAVERLRSSPLASNPAELRRAEAIARQEWRYRESQKADAEKATGLAIYDKVVAAPPNAPLRTVLTPAELQFLGRDGSTNTAIERYRDLTAEGGIVKDDPVTVDSIYRLQATDPAAFAKLPLAQYADKLSGKTLRTFTNDQAEATKPEKVEDWLNQGDRLEIAYAGLGITDNKVQRGAYDILYMQALRDLHQQLGRKPSPVELDALVRSTSLIFAKRMAAKKTSIYVEGRQAVVSVPQVDRNRVRAKYREEHGVDPTEAWLDEYIERWSRR